MTPPSRWTGAWTAFFAAPAEVPLRANAETPTGAVLDEAPPVDLTVRRTPLADLLRPGYQATAAAGRAPDELRRG